MAASNRKPNSINKSEIRPPELDLTVIASTALAREGGALVLVEKRVQRLELEAQVMSALMDGVNESEQFSSEE